MSRFTAPLHVTLSYMPLARLARRPFGHMRLAARPDLGRLPLFGIPGSTAPGAVASRGTAGIAARAILVRVMLAGVSNIAAGASNLMRGKSVRHVGQRLRAISPVVTAWKAETRKRRGDVRIERL